MIKKSKEKIERALGMKLGLKAERCNSPKCVMVRRPSRPGQHGKKRRRAGSEYATQLLEKQRIRASYILREKQFRNIVKKALDKKGVDTGEEIITSLERQLSNAIFRIGFAPSRVVAKQLVGHGHLLVNGRKVSIPTFQVKIGDVISIRPSSKEKGPFRELAESLKKYNAPEWIELDKEKLQAKIKSLPKEIEIPFDINLIVDFYSK